jgi:hypothetical protein
MNDASRIPETLVRRLEAQHGPLGVDVRMHLANVVEMNSRIPGGLDNPPGLLVTWCQREAEALAGRRAKQETERERYAELQGGLYAEISARQLKPREVARILDEASRCGFPAISRRTIDRLRAMGDRWQLGELPAPRQSRRRARWEEPASC